jgi:tetratricopeptide (TPR) repeat protein
VPPLRSSTRRQLEYATGYLTLNLKREAAEALDEIDPADRDLTPVLSLRAAVHCELAEWASAAPLLAILCEREPGEAGHWVQYAYATRRHLDIETAREILRRGLALHPHESTIHFNLACYAAQLGELEAARLHLNAACKLDPAFVALSRTDPDLAPLRIA